MVSAYAAFANGGIGVQPHVISRVRTADGKQLYARRNASFGRVIEPQYVAMMNEMMEETLLTGTAHKAELPGWQAAGKTGTSQDWRDAWFVGYTSYLVAGVWLGNDDNSPTKKVSGGNLPVEIWSRFMKAAHEGVPVAGLPLGDLAQSRRAEPLPAAAASARSHGRAGADAAARRTRRRRAGLGERAAREFCPAGESSPVPAEPPEGAATSCCRLPRSRMAAVVSRRTPKGCSTDCSGRREERCDHCFDGARAPI